MFSGSTSKNSLPEVLTIFFSEDALDVIMHQYYLFIYMQRKTYIAFTCVNPLLFFTPFHYFNCFTFLQHDF